MRKMWYMLFAVCFLSFIMYKPAYAEAVRAGTGHAESAYAGEEAVDLGSVWGQYDLEEVSRNLKDMLPDYEWDTRAILDHILQGEIFAAAGLVWDGIRGTLGAEVAGLKNIFAAILILGIVSALFSNFSDIFQNHQVADISFYFLYLLLMAVLMKAFLAASGIASGMVADIVLFIKMFIPTYFMAVGAAQGPASAIVYYQFMLLLAYGVEKLLSSVLLPMIYSYVLLALMNGVWAEERLTLLLECMKKGIGLGLKVALGAVTSLSVFQSMITPVLDSLQGTAVKKAISVIPGIGNLAEGVTEMVVGSAVLIKNSIGLLLLLLLLAVCLVPLAKLFLIACVMKGSAALAGIVSDRRITGCTDRVGDGSLLLFRTAFTAVALFLIVIAVVAYTTGKI